MRHVECDTYADNGENCDGKGEVDETEGSNCDSCGCGYCECGAVCIYGYVVIAECFCIGKCVADDGGTEDDKPCAMTYGLTIIITQIFERENISSWALANLMLTIFGIVLSDFRLIPVKRKNGSERRYGSRKITLVGMWRLYAINITLLILTQDFRGIIVLFDRLTLIFAGIAIICVERGNAEAEHLKR